MEIKPYLRKVQFYETDAMGIVHHANYVRWMEECRVHFMDEIGYSYAKCSVEGGIDIALTDIKCEYKGMVRFGDTVRMEMDIIHISLAKLRVRYRMYDAATGQLRFEGESGHFFYNNRKGQVTGLKRVLPELYELLCSLCVKE